MNATILVLIAIAVLTPQLSASRSPLVYFVSKEIDSTAILIDAGSLDTLRFKQIRVQIENVHEKVVSRSDYSTFRVHLVAVEKDAEVLLVDSHPEIRYSIVLDTPPSKLRVKIAGRGTFRIFVWASQ